MSREAEVFDWTGRPVASGAFASKYAYLDPRDSKNESKIREAWKSFNPEREAHIEKVNLMIDFLDNEGEKDKQLKYTGLGRGGDPKFIELQYELLFAYKALYAKTPEKDRVSLLSGFSKDNLEAMKKEGVNPWRLMDRIAKRMLLILRDRIESTSTNTPVTKRVFLDDMVNRLTDFFPSRIFLLPLLP